MRENREIHGLSVADVATGRIGKASGCTTIMNDPWKSDRPVVPAKSPNNATQMAAEGVEGRGLVKGNSDQQNASRTQSRSDAPSALDRVRQVAAKDKKAKFTALLHHVSVDLLRAAFHALRKKAAPGIDGVTWEQYEADLEANLHDLHSRLHRGAYRAKASKRVFIPKADGRQRPLGIASLEDKIVQRALVQVLNAIYEQDFLGFSYGFRPRRSPHQALDALVVGLTRKKVNWVLDADIRGFFDTIDHEWLMKFVEHRVADKRVLRLLRKWLTAGAMASGDWMAVEHGTPQGATISPLLANIYLHYVLDLWVQQWRRRHARGDVVTVRFADDFVVGFQHHADAVRFKRELAERLRQFSLELHSDKTRMLSFGRYAIERSRRDGRKERVGTFNFLGFTHICGRSLKGTFFVTRHTQRERMRAKLKEVRTALMQRRHLPLPEQGKWLGQVVRGYFGYHAVPSNIDAMQQFRTQVERHWRFALLRRSQRGGVTWQKMRLLSAKYLPTPRVLHPWPEQRFDANTRGRSRVR